MKDKSPNIFEYLDFREYLKDWCAFQKKNNPVFSHRNFAKAAGIPVASASILAAVIKGARNLSQSYLVKFSIAMMLKERESQYFKNLVQFNQSKSMEEKNYYFSLISKVRGSRAAIVKDSQAKFYSRWYYAVVWNYLSSEKSGTNPNEIAKKMYPQLTSAQVKEAIKLLLDLKLIKKLANGYATTDRHLSTEKEATALFTRQYMQELIHMSSEVFSKVPQNKRQYNALVFSVSDKGVETIKERMRTFQEELREIIERDEKENSVYTLTMQLYPNVKNF
jgi:uncharacterized protein (TIGR02147 family)